MFLTAPFRNKYDLLSAALKAVKLNNGLYCEFGVHSGSTINHIAEQVNGPVYGFDSFEGLPEDWRPGVEKGNFRMDALPEGSRQCATGQGLVQREPFRVS